MTNPEREFRRYLEQRLELGEAGVIFDDARLAEAVRDLAHEAATQRRTAVPESDGVELNSDRGAGPSKPAGKPAPSSDEAPKWRKGAPDIPPDGLTIERPASNLFAADPLADKSLDEVAALIHDCSKCGLCQARTNAVPGEGPADADLMVIGEGPGANEDAQGRPFVGRAGDLLNQILGAIECPRATVYIANVVKCRPPNNRNPERDEIAECMPYLHRQIALVAPKVIIAMGSTAACSLLETRGSLTSLRNKVHRFHGIPLVVTYHPAALLRNPNWKKPTWDDVRIARRLLAGER